MKANKLTPQEIFEKAISGKEITPEEREVLRRTLSTPFHPDSLSGNEKLKDKEENKARMGTKVSSTLGGYIPNVVKQELTQAKSGIHIKPENKGKFTASAKRAGMGVQEFASHVLANKDDYSSTQVKRANFSRNASKWKHQDGGDIMSADSTKYFSNSNRDEYQTGGYLPVYKTRNGKQPEIPKKKKVIPNSRLMQRGGSINRNGKVISADSVVKYENGSEEYNNKGYIPNAQDGDYINGGREDNWTMPTKLFLANKQAGGHVAMQYPNHKTGFSADSQYSFNNINREYNNYQEGGYADKYQDRLDQYIREGLYPQEQPTMYDQNRGPLDYGINKQLGNFSTKAGAYMDMMNSNPGIYGSVGFNKGKFNSNVEHKRGIGNKSTNVDMSYFGDKFNAGINYSNDSFMGKRFGASAGYNSPNTSIDLSYFNNNGQPEVNANVGFRKGNYNAGVGYTRHAGQNHLQGNVGYSNKDYDVNLSGNYSPEHSEFNAGVNYRLGNRKVQKQDPIQLSQEVIDELDVISGKKPVESNEAAYPVKQIKEGKMGGSLTCHKCGGYTHMQTGGRACGCRHKRK